jgi:hypothetical protein
MKVPDAINFCLQYHKINSRPNTIKNYEFLLGKFRVHIGSEGANRLPSAHRTVRTGPYTAPHVTRIHR